MVNCRIWHEHNLKLEEQQPNGNSTSSTSESDVETIPAESTTASPSSQPTSVSVSPSEYSRPVVDDSFMVQLEVLFKHLQRDHPEGVPVTRFFEPLIIDELASENDLSHETIQSAFDELRLNSNSVLDLKQFKSFMDILAEKMKLSSTTAPSSSGMPRSRKFGDLAVPSSTNNGSTDPMFFVPGEEQKTVQLLGELHQTLFNSLKKQVLSIFFC
jgi:DNA repair photolyase